MRNFVRAGDTITLAAPYDRTSGQGAQVGQLFGVCTADALSGADAGVLAVARTGEDRHLAGALASAGSGICGGTLYRRGER